MARDERTEFRQNFIEETGDFNEQLLQGAQDGAVVDDLDRLPRPRGRDLVHVPVRGGRRDRGAAHGDEHGRGRPRRPPERGRPADARGDRGGPPDTTWSRGADDQGRGGLRPQRDRQRPPDRGVARRAAASPTRPSRARPNNGLHRHRRRRGRRLQGPRRSPQPARGRRRQEGRRRGRGRAAVARRAPVARTAAGSAEGFDKWCDGKPNAGERPRRPRQGAMYDVGRDGPRALRVPRRRLHATAATTFAKVVRNGPQVPEERPGPRGLLRPAHHAALHLQPRDRRARDGRGLRHDGVARSTRAPPRRRSTSSRSRATRTSPGATA